MVSHTILSNLNLHIGPSRRQISLSHNLQGSQEGIFPIPSLLWSILRLKVPVEDWNSSSLVCIQLAGRESSFCHLPGPLPTACTPGSPSCHPLEPCGRGQVCQGLGVQELKGLGAINNGDFPLLSCFSLRMASTSFS